MHSPALKSTNHLIFFYNYIGIKMKMKHGFVLTVLLLLPLSGCATNDSYTSDDQQDRPGMSGQQGMSQGAGGGGGRGGGGPQQGPPNMAKDDSKTDEVPPTEAFTACEGKQEGDFVVFILSEGKQIKATCQIIDDHMVAVPQKSGKPDRK